MASQPSSKRRKSRPMGLERLECRCVLSASATSLGTDGFHSAADVPGTVGTDREPFQWQLGSAPMEIGIPFDGEEDPVTEEFLSYRRNEVFNLQSKPDSNFTIYLDFDGHVSEGTTWNSGYGVELIDHPPYDIDGNPAVFGLTELNRMELAWQRVAEDFAAFDVNVTTVEPSPGDLTFDGAGDTRWGIRSVATQDTFADCGCGGHAWIGSFQDDADTAALVYNAGEGALGETISHEVGHSLNLSHDGTLAGDTYYDGHGIGSTSWGAIMGAPFDKEITHWDEGRYFDANNGFVDSNYGNGASDIAVITTTNGFGFRADDHGNSTATATTLDVINVSQLDGFGIIETESDVDYFSFETTGGMLTLQLETIASRPNLDIWAGLYDATGSLVTQSNPSNNQSASFSQSLTAGTYFIKVDGVGSHGVYNAVTDSVEDPVSPPWQSNPPSGYSDYGSQGQYWINGTVAATADSTFSIEGVDDVVAEGNGGSTTMTFEVTRSATGTAASVDFTVLSAVPVDPGTTYPHTVDGTDFVGGMPLGTLNFEANESSRIITLQVAPDSDFEFDEYFTVKLANPSTGWRMATDVAQGIIVTDESELLLQNQAGSPFGASEGDPFADSVVLRWRQVQFSSGDFDNWGLDNVSVAGTTFSDDFQDGIDQLQWGRVEGAIVSNIHAGGTNALFFNGAGRTATARILDANPGDSVSFDLIFSNGSNGGENADGGEDVVLEYSTDQGASWRNLALFDTEGYGSWTTINIPLPSEIETPNLTEFKVAIDRVGDLSQAATVNWSVDTGGLSNPASSNDFVGGVFPAGQASFAPFESRQEISLMIQKDLLSELDERFRVQLSNAVSAGEINISSAFGTLQKMILDDESSTDFKQPASYRWRQDDSADGGDFDTWALDNVTSSGGDFSDDFDPAIDLSQWTLITGETRTDFVGGDGNQLFMNGEDRVAQSRPLDLQVGESIDFDLIIGNDANGGENADEGEDVYLEYSLDGGVNWTLQDTYDTEDYGNWTTLSVPVPDIVATDAEQIEEGDSGQVNIDVTLIRGGNLEKFVVVDYVVAGGAANPANGADFVGGVFPEGSLTFAPGESTKVLSIGIQGDLLGELDESFRVTLSEATGGGIIGTVDRTILNDDAGLPGDFNMDGDYDCQDIGDLTTLISLGLYGAFADS